MRAHCGRALSSLLSQTWKRTVTKFHSKSSYWFTFKMTSCFANQCNGNSCLFSLDWSIWFISWPLGSISISKLAAYLNKYWIVRSFEKNLKSICNDHYLFAIYFFFYQNKIFIKIVIGITMMVRRIATLLLLYHFHSSGQWRYGGNERKKR